MWTCPSYCSLLLAVSPSVKREYVSQSHFSLASIFNIVDPILGMPTLNQYDGMATDARSVHEST